MNYASPVEAARYYGVCVATIREWSTKGKIEFIKTDGGHRRYILPTIENAKQKKSYIYARVSSKKQKKDLERQIEFIRSKYPDYEVVQDIGSGLNSKRQGFRTILEQLFERNIEEVIVSSADRFSRIGAGDFFKWLFQRFGAKLTVLDNKLYESKEQELAQELLEIITVFTARYHGKRSYTNYKKSKDLSESDSESDVC